MQVDILSSLVTERLGNRLWVLVEPFIFSIDGVIYAIPRGFVTDGASCPRIMWSICAPVAGPFGEGAVIHDWFHSIEGPDIGRFSADMALYTFGRFRGANIFQAQMVKSGVNWFGWLYYKKGVEKLTAASCYNLIGAMLRVANLALA